MKVGVIARANGRGLHVQTAAAAKALEAAVLVVDIENHSSARFPTDRRAFPSAPVVSCRPGWRLDETPVRRWLEQVDAVYTAETMYDVRLPQWAADADARVAVHLNPEFVPPPGEQGWGLFGPGPDPDWWSATSWRLDHLPTATRVIPFPVDPAPPVARHDGPCRWVHVAGKAALGDRNGTEALLEAIPHLRRDCSITIVTQESNLPGHPSPPPGVTVRVITDGVANRSALYDGHDALVMPRRYGGLCLPVQEAMAHGMAVLMTDCPPNATTWPVSTVPTRSARVERMPAGMVPIADIDPGQLAAAMDALAVPALRHQLQDASDDWTAAHGWDVWADRYRALMAVPCPSLS